MRWWRRTRRFFRAHRWICFDAPSASPVCCHLARRRFCWSSSSLAAPRPFVTTGTSWFRSSPSVLAWVGLLWFRSWLSKSAGTLYYVRMLDPSMTDWHEAAERHARDEYLQLFEVSRDTLMEERDGVIDVRSQRRRAFEYLEELFNNDDQSTGFSVAPNMLWPVALGLGYRAALRPGSTLLDFGEGADTEFEWAPDAAAGGWPAGRVAHRASRPGLGTALLATMTTQVKASWPQWQTGSRRQSGPVRHGRSGAGRHGRHEPWSGAASSSRTGMGSSDPRRHSTTTTDLCFSLRRSPRRWPSQRATTWDACRRPRLAPACLGAGSRLPPPWLPQPVEADRPASLRQPDAAVRTRLGRGRPSRPA